MQRKKIDLKKGFRIADDSLPVLRVLHRSGHGAADLTDLFAFTSPENPSHTVLAANVFPSAGVSSMFSNAVNHSIVVRRVGALWDHLFPFSLNPLDSLLGSIYRERTKGEYTWFPYP